MESRRLTIGALAARTKCTVPTIRYYEEIGLLPPAARAANGRRYYDEADQQRLHFIKRCRDFGFPIDRVRELASIFQNGERGCAEVRDLARDQLLQVRTKLDELRQLEATLQSFVRSCDDVCIGGAARNCTIIEDLSTPAQSEVTRAGDCGTSLCVEVNPAAFREVKRH